MAGPTAIVAPTYQSASAPVGDSHIEMTPSLEAPLGVRPLKTLVLEWSER